MTRLFKNTMLLVDDEALMIELMCEALEPHGYSVVTAKDGEEAWRLLDEAPTQFDVVVTDLKMPKLNGTQLLDMMKQDYRLKHIPVIFQTGSTALFSIEEGIKKGVFHYLVKPYDIKVLPSLVNAALKESERYRHLMEESQRHAEMRGLLQSGKFQYRTLEESHFLAALLAQLSGQPDRTLNGISELLINAVEHGNLGITYDEKGELIQSGKWHGEIERRLQLPEHKDKVVTVNFSQDADQVCFVITDQGQGFDFKKYLGFDADRVMHIHGRGIAMAKQLSFDRVEYFGCGNQVSAILRTSVEV